MAKKYDEFVVCVSPKSIALVRNGKITMGSNETGMVLIDTDKQQITQVLDDTKYQKGKRILDKA